MPRRDPLRGVVVRALATREDADAVNRIYVRCGMVPAPADLLWANQQARHLTYLVAEDATHGRRSSAPWPASTTPWRSATPRAARRCGAWRSTRRRRVPGVGEALVRALVERFHTRGRAYLDLSVMHDNEPAIALYEKLGFERVPVFAVKRKNAINERLFVGEHEGLDDLNPYARIIADEALRRGIDGRGARRPGRRAAPVARRAQHRHPRVAVRADHRGGDEPLRRQAPHPPHPRPGRAAGGARAATPPFDDGDHDVPRRGRARSW